MTNSNNPYRQGNVVIIGAGFSLGAGQPLTRQILREAAEQEENVLPQIVQAVDLYLRDKEVIDRPLVEYDIEDLITLVRKQGSAFRPPIFPETISLGPGEPSFEERRRPLADYPLAFAHRTLLLIYWALVSDLYEPHPVLGPQAEESWDADLPEYYREFCQALPPQTTLITTNYDDILERSLLAARRSWSYGAEVFIPKFTEGFDYLPGTASLYIYDPFVYRNQPLSDPGRSGSQGDLIWARHDWKPPANPADADIRVCRLHGSFRWLQCRNCSRTYSLDWYAAHPVGDFLGCCLPPDADMTFTCWDRECEWFPITVAVIPGLEKKFSKSSAVLDGHWEAAHAAASDCGSLVIIGSALRDSDQELLSIVVAAAATAKNRAVVNPSESALHRAEAICNCSFDWCRDLGEFLSREL